mmetsp:Transcript_20341/g.34064  ORF Transcript_20341/g.34064 Transcript_20341/m.34064 type:complete len:139 (-) Transcript_20341:231-647(-)
MSANRAFIPAVLVFVPAIQLVFNLSPSDAWDGLHRVPATYAEGDAMIHDLSGRIQAMTTVFSSNTNLQSAADQYCSNPATAESTFGPIDQWDVSQVTSMRNLFYGCGENPNITTWDVSSVTDMVYMFYRAHDFNQNIG